MTVSTYPCLASHVRLEEDFQTGQHNLLFPEGVLLLNATAVAVLELCDGQRSIQEITDILLELYEGSQEDLEKDIRECLDLLSRRGFLQMLESPRSYEIPPRKYQA